MAAVDVLFKHTNQQLSIN